MKLGAVIVTFNRLDCLKKCLSAYDNSIENVDVLIVVNNNSSDGTGKYLEDWKKQDSKFERVVLNLEENLGGSGGFFEGLKYASENKLDWIWIHDDDAYIQKNTISELKKRINENNVEEVSAICAKVINGTGIQFSHRSRIRQKLFKVKTYAVPEEEYKNEFFLTNTFSYVGIAINNKKLNEVGLTNKDFFIHNDDIEHGYRLSKVGKIITYPSIEIIHDNKEEKNNEITWKTYYSVRNHMFFIKKYFCRISYYYQYFYYFCLAIFKGIIKKDKETEKLILKAMKDANNNKLGKDNYYKPGWKINKI